MFEKKDFILKYENKFEIAFFDIMDTGALFLFDNLKIKNIFAINNKPLLPYQFEYADKLTPNKIPGFILIKYYIMFCFICFRLFFIVCCIWKAFQFGS